MDTDTQCGQVREVTAEAPLSGCRVSAALVDLMRTGGDAALPVGQPQHRRRAGAPPAE